MITIIKRGSTKKEINSQLERHGKKQKGIDLKKYFGSIKLKEDPLNVQKSWRDEWE